MNLGYATLFKISKIPDNSVYWYTISTVSIRKGRYTSMNSIQKYCKPVITIPNIWLYGISNTGNTIYTPIMEEKNSQITLYHIAVFWYAVIQV